MLLRAKLVTVATSRPFPRFIGNGVRNFAVTQQCLANAEAKLAASGLPFVKAFKTSDHRNTKMFCAQCSQHNQDCTISVGNCKKTPQVANLQDEMMKLAKEIGYYAHAVRGMGKTVPNHIDRGTLICIFATLTNVNNDATRFTKYKRHGRACVEELKYLCGPRVTAPVLPDASILAQREAAPDANASSLCEMLAYGIKGVAAYADHAAVFGKEDQKIYAFIHEALSFLTSPERHDPSKALEMCLRCGEANLWTMDLLYQANTTLGIPEPTEVQVKPEDGKCILVSGHDLKVVSSLLEACEKEDIKVYTHGELLPANSYPKLKKFKCLVGHYGGAWNRQHHEFSHFPGPIVMTSNCLTEPQNTYKNQVFTFGPVGWPGVKHLGKDSNKIDWSSVIKLAQQLDGFSVQDFTFSYDPVSGYGQPSPTEPQMVGFGHEAVLGAAETVLAGVKGGAISRFFLIGGCDGDAAQRNYFTNLAEKLPDTSVVLTLGCAKFRVSDAARARLGQIGDTGIPRVLDVGQCNDSYSAVRIAMGLADALECKISDLPLSIVLSWHEQKAIAVLLTCLHLGLKPIRLGPTLPAFLTEDVLQVLVKEFGIKVCNDVDADLKEMMDAKAAS